jgi:hypothetical protein
VDGEGGMRESGREEESANEGKWEVEDDARGDGGMTGLELLRAREGGDGSWGDERRETSSLDDRSEAVGYLTSCFPAVRESKASLVRLEDRLAVSLSRLILQEVT